eukprot:1178787-Prorocentrum_minimum.AAC.3
MGGKVVKEVPTSKKASGSQAQGSDLVQPFNDINQQERRKQEAGVTRVTLTQDAISTARPDPSAPQTSSGHSSRCERDWSQFRPPFC